MPSKQGLMYKISSIVLESKSFHPLEILKNGLRQKINNDASTKKSNIILIEKWFLLELTIHTQIIKA